MGSVSNLAWQASGYSLGYSEMGTTQFLYAQAAGLPTQLPFVTPTYIDNDVDGYSTDFEGASAASWNNKVVIFGGGSYDSGTPRSSGWVWELSCQGNATNGFDSWVNNASDFVGCDMVNCYKGYWGTSCTACDCNGQPCLDGYTGVGTCVCNQYYWGPKCANYQNCSIRGNVNDGLTGTGACICTTGYWGSDCSNGPVNCQNGATFERADGTCTCKPGFYGTTCGSTCTCGNGQCNDGTAGTGECTCAPGFYSPSGGASNCSQQCACGTGICDDGNYGTGICTCEKGYYGSNCGGVCSCPPVVYSPSEIKIFRCDDGFTGSGACVRLYSSASLTSTFFGLIVLCFSLLFL
jgi:hypothetical protein